MPFRYEQYPPPPPKPIYVDQYGRPVELIPVDAAPAPVQYLPHPYEQQQQYARQAVYASVQQPVYYEQQPPPQHGHGQGQQGRYVYEDEGRGSVPRG
jgi:hypothetical protein